MSSASEPASAPGDLDRELRRLLTDDGVAAAAGRAIAALGPELLGYLFAVAKSGGDAEELFSELCEKLWRALPQFRWDASFRTWAYAIARNLVRESHRRGHRRREVAIGEVPEVLALADRVRTETMTYMRSEVKARLDELRAALDEDDRTLLVLRVDRRMSWRDIAKIMREDDEDTDRLAARLRKRFERVKERLRSELVPPQA